MSDKVRNLFAEKHFDEKEHHFIGPASLLTSEGDLVFLPDLGTVFINGDLTAADNLIVHIGTEVIVNGNVKVGGKIKAAGDVQIEGTLETGCGVYAGESLTLCKDANIRGRLRVTGDLVAQSALTVGDRLEVLGWAYLYKGATVKGTARFASDVVAHGNPIKAREMRAAGILS